MSALVLCPLLFERRALQRALRRMNAPQTWNVTCTGPGERVADWFAKTQPAPGRVVILAGVAAGLTPHAHAGSAWSIGAVVCARSGEVLRPTLVLEGAPSATLVCVDRILPDAAAKRAAAADTGAQLADMESAHFARAAQAAGLRWAVVRGVSDAWNAPVPAGCEHWTDARGHTRLRAVARALLRRPAQLPHVLALGRHSNAAMRAVAAVLAGMDHSPNSS